MINKTDIKIRLITLNKKQVDIIPILRERYKEKISTPELSRIINGIQDDRKANQVRNELDIILSEWESERANPT